MKIAVLHRYPPEQVIGTNASFLEFLKKLSQKKHEIFYLTYKDRAAFPRIKNLNYLLLPFYFDRGNNLDKLVKTALWILLAPLYVSRLALQKKLDLIYCDDSVPYYGFITKVLNPFTKVVIRLGDLQIGYSLADNNPILFKIALFFEKMMWRFLDGMVPISQDFKEFMIREGIDKNKLKVVEESINLNQKNIPKNKSTKNFHVLFHGSLVSCKGLTVLIDAFAEFNKKYPGSNLAIAGGGGEEDGLKSYVKTKKFRNITFTGWYNHKKLTELMRDVNISVVMRSQNMANNFVVTTCLLENWKFKKPVIVPRLAALEKVVKDKQNGILFEPGNSKDLSDKMEFLYLNRKIWPKLANNGHKTAKRYFDHKQIAEKMVLGLENFL